MGDMEWNQPFSTGGWVMLRGAPGFNSAGANGTLISKMDTTQHYRGWDMTLERGMVSVDIINEAPKDLAIPKEMQPKKPYQYKEPFDYPAPNDLTAQDLAADKDGKKREEKKPAAKKTPPKPEKKEAAKKPEDETPWVAIKVSTIDPLPVTTHWSHVMFTYDGSGKAEGVKIYVDGVPVKTRVVFDTLKNQTVRTTAPMQLGWRYPDSNPKQDTRYQDIRLYGRVLSSDEVRRVPLEDYVAEVTSKPSSQWNADQWHAVADYYFDAVDKKSREITAQLADLDKQLEKLSEGGTLTQVAWERNAIPYANVLTRGIYSAREDRVEANTPHYLPAIPAGEQHDRRALAKWTVSPENPLTARVSVNRMWYEVFGTGLVETNEDFGIMGQRPSHPELLDWLAVEFRESGWNVKHMYKLMVMSAAYRQSAKSTPEQLTKDPKNLLLSHGPRFRMDAEMLRDIALQSSGLLVNKIGGPSVKPYQPANVWEQVSYSASDTLVYTQQHGDALYRRSMYTYWKRMAIMPDMDAFDAPMRDAVCTRRQRTDTPLQALVTMDDVQWVEAARALAERAIREGGSKPEARIRLMSDILLAHDPSPQTLGVLENSLGQMEKMYAADPKAAEKLIHVGEKPPAGTTPSELAAWTMVASEILNLDETITK